MISGRLAGKGVAKLQTATELGGRSSGLCIYGTYYRVQLQLSSVLYLAYETHLAISLIVGLFPYINSPTR
jgi:hypothetical protein